MQCLTSLSNNFRFTSSCFSVSSIFFGVLFFSLSFLDVFFFFPLLLLFVPFRLLFVPIYSFFYYSVKQTSLSTPSGYVAGLSVNLSICHSTNNLFHIFPYLSVRLAWSYTVWYVVSILSNGEKNGIYREAINELRYWIWWAKFFKVCF